MKVLHKLGSVNDIFQRKYNIFSKNCFDKNTSLEKVKFDFYTTQDLFVKSGQVEEFTNKTNILCNAIENIGNRNISDLLINELSKLCVNFNLQESSEKIIYRAIMNCRKNKDGLHELARIIDLEKIYTKNKNKKLVKILNMKKNCCEKILKDYNSNARNFRSLIKIPTSKYYVEAQLATTYCQLAEKVAPNQPNNAIALLQKAKMINKKLKRYRAANYNELCIKDIMQNNFNFPSNYHY